MQRLLELALEKPLLNDRLQRCRKVLDTHVCAPYKSIVKARRRGATR
jgi:hypothetical protein